MWSCSYWKSSVTSHILQIKHPWVCHLCFPCPTSFLASTLLAPAEPSVPVNALSLPHTGPASSVERPPPTSCTGKTPPHLPAPDHMEPRESPLTQPRGQLPILHFPHHFVTRCWGCFLEGLPFPEQQQGQQQWCRALQSAHCVGGTGPHHNTTR